MTAPHPALTMLSEEEALLLETALDFAHKHVSPHVRAMDEQASMPRSIIDGLFNLGVMGIEVPEQYGGSEASFLSCRSEVLRN